MCSIPLSVQQITAATDVTAADIEVWRVADTRNHRLDSWSMEQFGLLSSEQIRQVLAMFPNGQPAAV